MPDGVRTKRGEGGCTCTTKCDCQNPTPDGQATGVFHASEECPEHNEYPDPNPECPIHGGMDAREFDNCSTAGEVEEPETGQVVLEL